MAASVSGLALGLVEDAVGRLRSTGATVAAVPLPAAALDRLTEGGLARLRRTALVSWERPREESAWFGIGVAARAVGRRGADRADASEFLRALSIGFVDSGAPVRAWFGFEFDPETARHDAQWEPFGGWQAVLPRLLVGFEAGEWRGSFIVADTGHLDAGQLGSWLDAQLVRDRERPVGGHGSLAPGGPSGEVWGGAVTRAVAEIGTGDYRKVVLARREALRPAVTTAEAITRLADRYPDCFVFRFDAGPSAFIGASPERLVSLEGGRVRADSLAGSRPRGATDEEDAALAAELLASTKELEEHALVVDAIRSALEPACTEIATPEAPRIMRLANIQHLHTPVTGTASPGTTILDLAALMHPTPAVGGFPQAEALDAIRRLEELDRGWYAGPVGWAGLDGDGEFAVALRTALVGPHGASLYAGCGIVGQSEPERELAETEWKFQPLREALT